MAFSRQHGVDQGPEPVSIRNTLLGLLGLIFLVCWETTSGFGYLQYLPVLKGSYILSMPTPLPSPRPGEKNAYATLLYSDDFVVGVFVLGESLDRVGSVYPKVCIVSPKVSDYTRQLLIQRSWIIKEVVPIENPHKHERHFQPRLLWAFTKLNIFALDYDKVVYLDADMLVMKNIDHVFKCGSFCAVMRDNHFNTGFLVLTPSPALFNEMTSEYDKIPSYNAGEQGFTNQKFPELLYMPLFDPTNQSNNDLVLRTPGTRNSTRLTNLFNGDEALYYMRDSTWITGDPYIIHYTMIIFKPWIWFEYLGLSLNWLWLEHNPLDTEPVSKTVLRMLIPVLCYVSCTQLLLTMERVVCRFRGLVQSWAWFIHSYSWVYSMLWSTVNWVWVLGIGISVFLVIPPVPILHPFVACVLFVEWVAAVLAVLLKSEIRIHYFLGSVIHFRHVSLSPHRSHQNLSTTPFPRPSPEHSSRLYLQLFWCIGVTLTWLIAELLFTARGPGMLFRMISAGLLLILGFSQAFYRLPLVAFRAGQKAAVALHHERTFAELREI